MVANYQSFPFLTYAKPTRNLHSKNGFHASTPFFIRCSQKGNHQPKYGNNQCIFVPKFIMHEYPFFRHFCYSEHYAHFFKSKCITRFAFGTTRARR